MTNPGKLNPALAGPLDEDKLKTALMIFVLCTASVSAAVAQTCTKHSPAHTVALLELYTSEGCSSCPPADRAVSQLRINSGGAGTVPGNDQVVPLALHVDYWDYIGWKDVFSSKIYTDRQRWLSNLANSRTIYTPEIFVGGQELRNWSGGTEAAVRRVNQQPARAEIGITLGKLSGSSLPVEVSAESTQVGKLFVALYENNLVSQVKGGENSGVTLRHDYVVRQWVGPIALGPIAGNNRAALTNMLAVPAGAVVSNLGVAAFVQNERGEVLQSLALPLCRA